MNRLFITSATDAGNLTVHLTFSDNTERTVNVGEFIRLHPHPQYNKYLDPRKFKRFTIENGNIVWGKNWDLMFPVEQLIRNSLRKNLHLSNIPPGSGTISWVGGVFRARHLFWGSLENILPL
jgi:hypothetical protein